MVDVTYKCACMKDEATISVPDRRPGADLMLWMECTQHCIAMDHKSLSPTCLSNVMQYAKIPMDETTGIVGRNATKN